MNAKFIYAGIATASFALLSNFSLGEATASSWQLRTRNPQMASQLIEHVEANFLADTPVSLEQASVQAIAVGNRAPIYIVKSEKTAAANPSLLCDESGCLHMIYTADESSGFKQVWYGYIESSFSAEAMIRATGEVQAGLPVLEVLQLEADKLQRFELAFNGDRYQARSQQPALEAIAASI